MQSELYYKGLHKSGLKNLGNIESATYYLKGENWAPGNTAASDINLSARTIMLSPKRILKIGAKRNPPEVIPPGNYEALLPDRKGTKIQKVISSMTNTPGWRPHPFVKKVSFTGERSEVAFVPGDADSQLQYPDHSQLPGIHYQDFTSLRDLS